MKKINQQSLKHKHSPKKLGSLDDNELVSELTDVVGGWGPGGGAVGGGGVITCFSIITCF